MSKKRNLSLFASFAPLPSALRKVLSILNGTILLLALFVALPAQADTYTVSNTNDSGAGSLRVAMLEANATSIADTIVFNIPGGGVHTITPAGFLPDMEYSVTIDGTTQPGYAGVPLIEINAVNCTYGLSFNQGTNTSMSFTVRGLIINRASDDGLHIIAAGTFEILTTTITGCYIGTNASGTTDLGNGGDGIEMECRFAHIGGTALGQRNVISGNGGHGISYTDGTAFSGDIEIYNNYIGTNAAGTGDLGNTLNGIYIRAGIPVIGGTSGTGVNRGNVISGNNGNGILLSQSSAEDAGATIQRNLIGTNAAGTGDLGNSQNGILIEDGADHLIGSSTDSVDGNVISGNGGDINNGNGIKITSGASGTQIFGNRIGTNSAGTAILQNDSDGIEITNSSDNQIGLAGNNTARNVIAGNNLHGIILSGSGAPGNFIQNNLIGTNASGANLGNGGDGINITAAIIGTNGLHTIGGAMAGAGNTIAFNNNGHGVNIAASSSNNTVQNNTIHSNIGDGVNVSSSSATGNIIRQNAIYSNQRLGINLGAIGVTANDLNDGDSGANGLQNFPVLQKASATRIVGTLNSVASQNFTIDFYRVDAGDASGNGEGRYYLASTNVATVGNNADFNFAYAGLSIGQIITATATDASGNTSEFSQFLAVAAEPGDFRFAQAAHFTGENGGSILITVNRINGSNGTVTVDYATSNDTAVAGQDYTATSGTLTFLNGETGKTFSVPITNDLSDEPAETFGVTLSNPTNGSLLVIPSGALVTITDNDNPPTISVNDVALDEGNSGTKTFTFTVDLSAASGFDVSVDCATANGTATAGIDYTATNGTINFSSGETSKSFAVSVNGDLTVELNETFLINLTNPVNGALGDAQGVGTIQDDDNPGSLRFSAATYSTGENTSVLITVTRANGDAGTVAVDYTTQDGTATANADYTPTSGMLTFNDGETSKNFPVAILADAETELSENFNVVLSNPLGGATLGTPSTSVVNITPPAPSITSFLPPSGLVGSSVTIFGLDFADATGVDFNGVAATFVIESSTQILAFVPAGATSGPIAVSNSFGKGKSGTDYTVLNDSDGDGMSDDFEDQYFGGKTAGDPAADDDGDGETNLEEYLAGTNPIDPNSVFRIIEIRREGADIVIVFEAPAGRRYRVEAGADLFDNFPLLIQTLPPLAVNTTHEVTHANGAAVSKRFYRAAVVP